MYLYLLAILRRTRLNSHCHSFFLLVQYQYTSDHILDLSWFVPTGTSECAASGTFGETYQINFSSKFSKTWSVSEKSHDLSDLDGTETRGLAQSSSRIFEGENQSN